MPTALVWKFCLETSDEGKLKDERICVPPEISQFAKFFQLNDVVGSYYDFIATHLK